MCGRLLAKLVCQSEGGEKSVHGVAAGFLWEIDWSSLWEMYWPTPSYVSPHNYVSVIYPLAHFQLARLSLSLMINVRLPYTIFNVAWFSWSPRARHNWW